MASEIKWFKPVRSTQVKTIEFAIDVSRNDEGKFVLSATVHHVQYRDCHLGMDGPWPMIGLMCLTIDENEINEAEDFIQQVQTLFPNHRPGKWTFPTLSGRDKNRFISLLKITHM